MNEQKSIQNHIAEEMELILESYGKVSTKRMIDYVPMTIEIMFSKLVNELRDSIKFTDSELASLMTET